MAFRFVPHSQHGCPQARAEVDRWRSRRAGGRAHLRLGRLRRRPDTLRNRLLDTDPRPADRRAGLPARHPHATGSRRRRPDGCRPHTVGAAAGDPGEDQPGRRHRRSGPGNGYRVGGQRRRHTRPAEPDAVDPRPRLRPLRRDQAAVGAGGRSGPRPTGSTRIPPAPAFRRSARRNHRAGCRFPAGARRGGPGLSGGSADPHRGRSHGRRHRRTGCRRAVDHRSNRCTVSTYRPARTSSRHWIPRHPRVTCCQPTLPTPST